MVVERVNRRHAAQTLGLLDELRLSLFGVQSRRLHAALVNDGIAQAIDCRIAVDADRVIGVVLAAPASVLAIGTAQALGSRIRLCAVAPAGTPRSHASPFCG